jgi:2-oxoglutarate ferredoxin oxidoreductase subunit delta
MDQDMGLEKNSGESPGTAGAPAGEGQPEKPHPEYEIDIFRDWCKSCGICAAFCPRQCLGLDEHGAPVVKDAKRCTGCHWCELHCPDFAICIKELAAGKKQAEEAD